MEEQSIADFRILEVLVNDLGDRDCRLPLMIGTRNGRKRPASDETELAALEDVDAGD